jgi:hypothetical protein
VQRLEVALCSRSRTIDELHAQLEQARAQINRLSTAEPAQAQSQA